MTPAQTITSAGRMLFGEHFKAPMAKSLDVSVDRIDDWGKGRGHAPPPGVWRDLSKLIAERAAAIPAVRTAVLVQASLGRFKITLRNFDGTHIVVGTEPGLLFSGTLDECETYVAKQMEKELMLTTAELTPKLCRAARAYLGWSPEDMLEKTGVPVPALLGLESGDRMPGKADFANILASLEAGGVEFILEADGRGSGIRGRKPEFVLDTRNFHADSDGITFSARYRGNRFRFRVGRDVLDDLIRGNTAGDTGQILVAANRFRWLILRTAERAAIAQQDGPPGDIHLTHDHFPAEVW